MSDCVIVVSDDEQSNLSTVGRVLGRLCFADSADCYTDLAIHLYQWLQLALPQAIGGSNPQLLKPPGGVI